MCNFNGNLVAWMDGELASDIAVNVEKHVQSCADCRRQVALYESASRDFTAYYVMRDQSQPVAVSANRIPRWAPYAAAVVAILLVVDRYAIPRCGRRTLIVVQSRSHSI